MDRQDDSRVGGESFTVSDCFVWETIRYLDSATDYKEFLPHVPRSEPDKIKSGIGLIAFIGYLLALALLFLAMSIHF